MDDVRREDIDIQCPRCGSRTVAVARYILTPLSFPTGDTCAAECDGCGGGSVTAPDQGMAVARLRGRRLAEREEKE